MNTNKTIKDRRPKQSITATTEVTDVTHTYKQAHNPQTQSHIIMPCSDLSREYTHTEEEGTYPQNTQGSGRSGGNRGEEDDTHNLITQYDYITSRQKGGEKNHRVKIHRHKQRVEAGQESETKTEQIPRMNLPEEEYEGEAKAHTQRTRRQEIPDEAVQAYTDYIIKNRENLEYTPYAIGEDWVRFALLVHIVKERNMAQALDGAAHMVGRIFDNMLEQRPSILAILETCRRPYNSTQQFAEALQSRFGPQLKAAVSPLLDQPDREKTTWHFIARFLNSIHGITPQKRAANTFIVEHCNCSGFNFTAATETTGQNNIAAMWGVHPAIPKQLRQISKRLKNATERSTLKIGKQ